MAPEHNRLRRRRALVRFTALLAAVALAKACGGDDAPTGPPPPEPARPTTITVSPATVELAALSATVRLSAEVRDQNGNVMAGTAVTWSSGDAAVATVDGSGLVTAVANGTATVTATAGSATGTATVTVAQQVSAVAVSPTADTLVTGETLRLAAEAADANGHAVAGAEFAWASTDTLVTIVDESGLVTGAGAGEATVTATSSGVTGSAELTVVVPAPTTLTVTPDTLAFTAIGQTAQLAAEVRDQAGGVMEGVDVSWSSADTLVATADSVGLVTATGGGATTVAAIAGEASGETLVTVMQSAGSVVVSPAVDTVALGDTLRLVAEAFDENGHPVDGAEFVWSSSDATVATVDDTGLLRGVAEGRATISAMAGDAEGTAEIAIENPDRAALVALYRATDGRSWTKRDNWLSDAPLEEWYGVESNEVGRVISLVLPENALAGKLPGELGNLSELERLELTNNGLSGEIPPELGDLAKLERLVLARNRLSGLIPPELGNLSELRYIWLGETDLTGPVPPELGNLRKLALLYLGNGRLSGAIPPELGRLDGLRSLYLHNNEFTGGVPAELGDLGGLMDLRLENNQLTDPAPLSLTRITGLRHLRFQNNAGLCVSGAENFVQWARALETFDGPFCNEADVTALKVLYEAAGGLDWTNSDGWLDDSAIGLWHGVGADLLGRVVELDLAGNGLTGRLPPALGDLERMRVLRIGNNVLSGRLPVTLARLPLAELRYADTELCAPQTPSFQMWLDGIETHEGTGAECAPVSNRAALAALYEATNGPNWTNGENWLTDAPLAEWHGVGVDREGRVTSLRLRENGLAGSIPPEVGELAQLTFLDMGHNDLGGPVPPELSSLSELRQLRLADNYLTGPIPPELCKYL